MNTTDKDGLLDAFEILIDIYQDAQNGGTQEQRAAARGALKAAFKSAVTASAALATTPQTDGATVALTDGQRKLMKMSADCIAEAVTYGQDSFDEPPQPVSQWDYNAEQLVYALRAEIAATHAPAMAETTEARYQWLRRRVAMVDYSDDTVTKLTLLKAEGPTGEFLDDWIDGEIAAASGGEQ